MSHSEQTSDDSQEIEREIDKLYLSLVKVQSKIKEKYDEYHKKLDQQKQQLEQVICQSVTYRLEVLSKLSLSKQKINDENLTDDVTSVSDDLSDLVKCLFICDLYVICM